MTGLFKNYNTQKADKAIKTMVYGRLVSSKFFKRNFFATGMVVLFSVGFIAVRFDCVTSMETIRSLKNQINVMRTYKQSERSRYMTLTRESSMQHMVDSLNLGLAIPEHSPHTIVYDYE